MHASSINFMIIEIFKMEKRLQTEKKKNGVNIIFSFMPPIFLFFPFSFFGESISVKKTSSLKQDGLFLLRKYTYRYKIITWNLVCSKGW